MLNDGNKNFGNDVVWRCKCGKKVKISTQKRRNQKKKKFKTGTTVFPTFLRFLVICSMCYRHQQELVHAKNIITCFVIYLNSSKKIFEMHGTNDQQHVIFASIYIIIACTFDTIWSFVPLMLKNFFELFNNIREHITIYLA